MNATHFHRKTYVLTCDLGHKVKSLRRIGLETPDADDPLFTDIQGDIAKMISGAVPHADLKIIAMEDLADEILDQAGQLDNGEHLQNGLVVSTCPEISADSRGFTLELNRVVDSQGNLIGIGSRPGSPSLKDQLAAIAELSAGGSVVLVEDGSFSGGTLKYLVEQLRSLRVGVAAIVLGFAFPEAIDTLDNCFDGQLIVIEDGLNPDSLIDWLPDHDFLPFIPNCGRVVGHNLFSETHPLYDRRGFSYTVPYIRPFCSTDIFERWTSLGRSNAREVSLMGITASKKIYDRLSQMNGRQLKIADLQKGLWHVSIPLNVGNSLPDYCDIHSQTIGGVLMGAYNQELTSK